MAWFVRVDRFLRGTTVLVSLVTIGCDRPRSDQANSSTTAPSNGTALSAAKAAPQRDEAGAKSEHPHGEMHGGVVVVAGTGHAEMKVERDGELRVWLLDEFEQPHDPSGERARVRVDGVGTTDLPLHVGPSKQSLEARLPTVPAGPFTVLLWLGSASAPLRFDFKGSP